MMPLVRSLFLMLSGLFILSGCATMDSTTNVEWQTHQQRLSSIAHYSNSGKLGYIAPETRHSFNFQWQHSSKLTKLRLTTFLGQTVLNLQANEHEAVVETYDEETYSSSSAQELIKQLTGLSLPVELLNDWALGKPTLADDYQLNEQNTLSSLTKQIDGELWKLQYSSYQDITLSGITLPLPRSMKLIQGDITINIIISKWNVTQ